MLGDSGKSEVYNARCKGADTIELIVRSIKTLMTDKETEEVLAIRHDKTKTKMMDLKPLPLAPLTRHSRTSSQSRP